MTSTEPTVISLPIERVEELARFGHEFYQEGNLPGVFVPDVFVRTWRDIYARDCGTLFVLEGDNGEILGALGAILFPDPNDGALVATEMFWYVRKEHRGRGLLLLQNFEAWGKRRGAQRLAMVHLLKLMPEILGKLYQRLGYEPTETHYIKEI